MTLLSPHLCHRLHLVSVCLASLVLIGSGHGQWNLIDTVPVASSDSVELVGQRLVTRSPAPPTSVSVFDQLASGWTLAAQIAPADASNLFGGGEGGIALLGDELLVADAQNGGPPLYPGCVYSFERASDGTWAQSQKVVPSAASNVQAFGSGLSATPNWLFVSEPWQPQPSGPPIGPRVHVFHKTGSQWVQTQVLTDPDGAQEGYWGRQVAVSEDMALIGDLADWDGLSQYAYGAVYAYALQGTTWSLTSKIVDHTHYHLGQLVKLSGKTALIGSHSSPNGSLLHVDTLDVYDHQGSGWTKTASLYSGNVTTDESRTSVAGNRLIVDDLSLNTFHIFEHTPSGWTEVDVHTLQWFPRGCDIYGERIAISQTPYPYISSEIALYDICDGQPQPPVLPVMASICPTSQGVSVPQQIGTLAPLATTSVGGTSVDTVVATFNLDPAWAHLDYCYDFRWVNVLTEAINIFSAKPFHDNLGALPAVDPALSDGPEPYYYNANEWAQGWIASAANTIHAENSFSKFIDRPTDPSYFNSVLHFETYLVATDRTGNVLPHKAFSVLGGFSWRYYSQQSSVELCAALPNGTATIEKALQNGQIGSSTDPWFPGFPEWTPLADASLVDCIPAQGTPVAISLVSGGIQTISIDAGPANGALFQFVLGSTSGTAPGLSVGVYNVPLNADAYFITRLVTPNTSPLLHSFATLTSAGKGYALFGLPPGVSSALAGVTVNHSAVALGPNLELEFVTNPVPVAFVP